MANSRWADMDTGDESAPFLIERAGSIVDATMYIENAIVLANKEGRGTRVTRSGILFATVAGSCGNRPGRMRLDARGGE